MISRSTERSYAQPAKFVEKPDAAERTDSPAAEQAHRRANPAAVNGLSKQAGRRFMLAQMDLYRGPNADAEAAAKPKLLGVKDGDDEDKEPTINGSQDNEEEGTEPAINGSQDNEEEGTDKTTDGEKKGDPTELSKEDLDTVAELKARDTEVRAHEQAHIAAAGDLATGGAKYSYQTGPDGRRYAIGGEVNIDVSPDRDPKKTIAKAARIQRAAMAPAEPSGQDRRVAARAARMAQSARTELAAKQRDEVATAQKEAKAEQKAADESLAERAEVDDEATVDERQDEASFRREEVDAQEDAQSTHKKEGSVEELRGRFVAAKLKDVGANSHPGDELAEASPENPKTIRLSPTFFM